MKTAFIFPAFVSEYIGTEVRILNSLSGNFGEKLTKASHVTGDDFEQFSIEDEAFTRDELRSQIVSYIFSCSLSDALIFRRLNPDMLAGYSMGLYAALYSGGSVNFEEGLKLIVRAFNLTKSVIRGVESGMGSIIGLTRDEIGEIIEKNNLEAEIANINSKYSHLVTGKIDAVSLLLDKAKETGALNTSLLNVHSPYHSTMLKTAAVKFRNYVSGHINIKPSGYELISSVNQRIFYTPDEILDEIENNLYLKINWMDSFNKMLSAGIMRFIECGAGKSLQKISRFMPGDFKVYTMNKIEKIIA